MVNHEIKTEFLREITENTLPPAAECPERPGDTYTIREVSSLDCSLWFPFGHIWKGNW
jgi:hypothetical protein